MNFIKIVCTLVATVCYGFNIYAAEKSTVRNYSSESKTSRTTRSEGVVPLLPLAATIEKLESYDDDFEEKNSAPPQKIQPKYGKSKSAEDLAAVALAADSRVIRYSSKKTFKEEK